MVVLQVFYNSFCDKGVKASATLESLVKFDRIINERILQPCLETITRLSRSHIQSDFSRALTLFEPGEKTQDNLFNWYNKLDHTVSIVKSMNN